MFVPTTTKIRTFTDTELHGLREGGDASDNHYVIIYFTSYLYRNKL